MELQQTRKEEGNGLSLEDIELATKSLYGLKTSNLRYRINKAADYFLSLQTVTNAKSVQLNTSGTSNIFQNRSKQAAITMSFDTNTLADTYTEVQGRANQVQNNSFFSSAALSLSLPAINEWVR